MKQRRIPLKSLYNARDLGGYPTADGGVTRFGVFIRSEAPVDLNASDIEILRQYGVTGSMDFRSTHETVSRPSDLVSILDYYHKPLFNEAASAGGMRTPPPMPMKLNWGEQYIRMVEDSREWATEVLSIAAEQPGVLLYHCTTGKDRTGIMTMYLLAIAGVAREDIAADYCVSEIYLAPVYERMKQERMGPAGDPKMGDSFFSTKAEYILMVYDYLAEHYGGVAEYLKLIGVSEEVFEKLREKLVDKS